MQIVFGSYVFSIRLLPLLAFACLLPVFISLGLWQWGRAEEKRLTLEKQGLRSDQPVILLNSSITGGLNEIEYRKAKLTGKYDKKHQFLIDNQIVDGRAGYFIMTPMKLSGQSKAVLVNRGWVPADYDRSKLPDMTIEFEKQTITGRIRKFPSVGIKLEGAEIPSPGWPSIIQVVDSQVIAKKLKYPLFGFQIQLDKELPDGYLRDWKSAAVTIPPEKHMAYSFQWFALAFTLVGLFLGLNIKKKDQ